MGVKAKKFQEKTKKLKKKLQTSKKMFASVFEWFEWAFSCLLEEGKITSKISFMDGSSKEINFSSYSVADAAACRVVMLYGMYVILQVSSCRDL